MSADLLIRALVGLLPVLSFLAALLILDSYKLVKLPAVVATVGCGVVVAGASYLVNGFILDHLTIEFTTYTRYVAPLVEEFFKGLVIFFLIATPVPFRPALCQDLAEPQRCASSANPATSS